MNYIVIISSYLVTYRLLRIQGLVDSLIGWLVLYFSQIVFTSLILGILGLLTLNNLIILNLLILLCLWLYTNKKPGYLNFNYLGDGFALFLNDKVLSFMVALIAIFAIVKICVNLMNPPFGWDSLNYHFTFAVEWLKNGNLNTPITVFDDPSPSYYPINGSLIYLWLIFPLKNVFLADLGQIPFFALALLSIYSISRKLSLSREYSLFAAGLFMLIPNFFKQLQIAYVDVMLAGLFLASLNYLFNLDEDFSFKNTLIYSASLGLLIGTKTIGLPYGLLLFLPFIYLTCKNSKKLYLFLFSILVIFLLGGFSYLRNFLGTANPLYPLQFSLFGENIFKGVMDSATYSVHFKSSDYSLSKALFHEGLGLQTILLVLPAVFLALPVALRKQGKRLNFFTIYFLTLPLLIYLVYRFVIPLANLRYLYAMLALGIILGFYTLKMVGAGRFWIYTLVIICVLASATELAKRQELVASVVLTTIILVLLRFIPRFSRLKIAIGRKTFMAILIVIMLGLLVTLEKWYEKNEFPRYIKMIRYSGFWPDAAKAWNWLNDNTTGNNIAYVGRPVPFPLYGTSFKNNVYYVSVNSTEPAKLHYFKSSYCQWDKDFASLHKNLEAKGNYRYGANYSVWLGNLEKRKTDYLFVYSLHQTKEIVFPMEDRWAMDHPEMFRRVFANSTIHIYRLIASR